MFFYFILFFILSFLKFCIQICFHCTENTYFIPKKINNKIESLKRHKGEKIIYVFRWTDDLDVKDSCKTHSETHTHHSQIFIKVPRACIILYCWPFFSPVSRHVMLHDSHTTYPKQKRSSAQHYWAKCFSTGYLFSGIA